MTAHIPSYPKVYNLGHPAIRDLFSEGDSIIAQEKVDGSQFSFGNVKGELVMRSKGADVYPETADKMFKAAVEYVVELFAAGKLPEGYTYRGEVLCKPQHNTLVYDRVPKHNIILFDIDEGDQEYMLSSSLAYFAEQLDLESVPFFTIPPDQQWSAGTIETTMMQQSVLGGQNIEGIVFKNYQRFGKDGKTLMGKHVSEAFKEVHRGAWKDANPTRQDIVEKVINGLKTPARWDKAVQHLAERGELTGTPKDIGGLIKEVQADTLVETKDEVMEVFFKHFWPQVSRAITGGLAEWYKDKLMQEQFVDDPTLVND